MQILRRDMPVAVRKQQASQCQTLPGRPQASLTHTGFEMGDVALSHVDQGSGSLRLGSSEVRNAPFDLLGYISAGQVAINSTQNVDTAGAFLANLRLYGFLPETSCDSEMENIPPEASGVK